LEEDGIVVRKIYAEVPPRVEYSLSELGESIRPIIAVMEKWGKAYKARFEIHRETLIKRR
jgi:DNA-binding HxlR family transcriptional regulator